MNPTTILLADDDVLIRVGLRAVLDAEDGLSVVGEATTGTEAVQQSFDLEPDLVVMDIRMPEMDGLEATAAIREREQTTGGRIPIIAMTAHAMKGDRERFLKTGMDGYIPKPVEVRQLYEAVEAVAPSADES